MIVIILVELSGSSAAPSAAICSPGRPSYTNTVPSCCGPGGSGPPLLGGFPGLVATHWLAH